MVLPGYASDGRGPTPLPHDADRGVLFVGRVVEPERHEHARGRIRAGQRVSKDVIDLAAGDSALDKRPGGGSAKAPAP